MLTMFLFIESTIRSLAALLRDVASWCLYLVTKPSHMRVDVDRLAYPLHQPMVCS
jgi:hypothetical protein